MSYLVDAVMIHMDHCEIMGLGHEPHDHYRTPQAYELRKYKRRDARHYGRNNICRIRKQISAKEKGFRVSHKTLYV
jgi:hypothetical protein